MTPGRSPVRDRPRSDPAGAADGRPRAAVGGGIPRQGAGRLRARPGAARRWAAVQGRPRRSRGELRARAGRPRPGAGQPRADPPGPRHRRHHPGRDRDSVTCRRHRAQPGGQPRRPGGAADLLPARHRAGHHRRHGRPDLQGHGGRDRRRQDRGRDAVPHQGGCAAGCPVTGRLSRIAPQAKKDAGATLFDVEIELDPEQRGCAAGRLLGQRRGRHPREARCGDDPRTAGGLLR